jgi:voltage-gated potassium channel
MLLPHATMYVYGIGDCRASATSIRKRRFHRPDSTVAAGAPSDPARSSPSIRFSPSDGDRGARLYEPQLGTMNSRQAFRQIRNDTVISLLALISVTIGVYDLARPRVDSRFTPLDWIDLFIVLIFIVECFVSARASGNWRQYVKAHWYELPSLLPITSNMAAGAETVPILRGLRLVRLVRVARLLRVVGAAARLRKFWRKTLRIWEKAHLTGLWLFAAFLMAIGAALAWLFESPTNEKFRGGESVWWALNMFTNVGYVDFQPKTLAGRVVAVILEFGGMAFIGLFTAGLANALLSDKEEDDTNDTAT